MTADRKLTLPASCSRVAPYQPTVKGWWDSTNSRVSAAQASGDFSADVRRAEHELQVFRVSQELRKLSPDFRLAFDGQVLNFTPFPQGSLLAEDGETCYRVEAAEEYLLFPNAGVLPGLRAGLMLVPQPFSALLAS